MPQLDPVDGIGRRDGAGDFADVVRHVPEASMLACLHLLSFLATADSE
jgi:hypothetical protein